MEEIDLTTTKDYMLGYDFVSKIYEIRDYFYFAEEKIEYDTLILNHKLLDLITEVNFVFVKGVGILEDINEIIKVGNLLNFSVYLDPLHEDYITMMAKGENKIDIKIIL